MREATEKQAKATEGSSSQRSLKKMMKKVCQVCGDRGYSNLLIYCSECSEIAIHRYCLGIELKSMEDTDVAYWACELCCPFMDSEPSDSQNGDAFNESGDESLPQDAGSLKVARENQLVLVEEQPEPLQIWDPNYCDSVSKQERTRTQCQCNEETTCIASISMDICDEAPISSLFTEIPKALMSELVLLVSPSGETTIHASSSFCDDVHLCGLETSKQERTSTQYQCNEETTCIASISMDICDEAPISSLFTEIPKALMSELVLLVSPSGETTSHACRSFYDDVHLCGLKTSTPILMNSPYNIISDTVVQQLSQCVMKPVSPLGEEVHEDKESGEDSGFHGTVELGIGSEEDMETCSVGETVELDLGTNEGDYACYSSEPYPSTEMEKHQDLFTNHAVDNPDTVHQTSNALRVDDLKQPVQTLPKCNIQKRQSCSESQDSADTLNESSTGKDPVKPTEASETSNTGDPSDLSITSSVLDMGSELLESTLLRIDVQVGRYIIRSDLALILLKILDKYGDIFCDCTVEPETLIVSICETIQRLQGIPIRRLRQQHVDYIRETLLFPDALGVDVKWMVKHCDYLQNIVHRTARYPALKQEFTQIMDNVRNKKKMLKRKRANPFELVEEFKDIEDELKLKVDRIKKLKSAMQNIKSLWSQISNKSLADGVF